MPGQKMTVLLKKRCLEPVELTEGFLALLIAE
jgi:hypothetical protein